MPELCIVIPALNPDENLVELVHELIKRGLDDILVIDDGSTSACRPIFDQVGAKPGVEIVRHEQNLGKGSAIKTAIRHVRQHRAGCAGIITVDADGQHLPEDVERIARTMGEKPETLVLGVRTFEGEVPFRSRLGNAFTQLLFRLFTGESVTDTQTGLRGIPISLAPELLEIPFARYEFEFEALIRAARSRHPVVQIPIRTVYIEANRASHFRPLVDSARIYMVFLRFSAVAILSFLLDIALFWVGLRFGASIPVAVIAARLVSGVFNFGANKLGVFASHDWKRAPRELIGFALLFVISMAASAWGTDFAVDRFDVRPVPAKIGVDVVLFFFNFLVQRLLIFRK